MKCVRNVVDQEKVGEFGNECAAEETRPRCFVVD